MMYLDCSNRRRTQGNPRGDAESSLRYSLSLPLQAVYMIAVRTESVLMDPDITPRDEPADSSSSTSRDIYMLSRQQENRVFQ